MPTGAAALRRRNVVGRTLSVDGAKLHHSRCASSQRAALRRGFSQAAGAGDLPVGARHRDLDVFARLRPGVDAGRGAGGTGCPRPRRSRRPLHRTNVNHRFRVIPLDKYYASVDPSAGRGLAPDARGGRPGAADRLRERREPAARPRRDANAECVIRAALGASRTRLARQLLIENLLLFLAGGGLGCFVAWWLLDSVVALAVAGGYVPERMMVSLDGRVLAFSLVRRIVTGLVFGLAPAWQASRVDLNQGLKDSRPDRTRGPRSGRTQAGADRGGVDALGGAARGLRTGHPQPARVVRQHRWLRARSAARNAGRMRGASSTPAVTRWRAALDRAGTIPGVESAAVSSRPPVHGGREQTFTVDGRAAVAPGQEPRAGDILDQRRLLRDDGHPAHQGACVQRAGHRGIAAGRDRQRHAGAPDLSRRGSDRPPDSPQRAVADDVLRRGRTGRERLA